MQAIQFLRTKISRAAGGVTLLPALCIILATAVGAQGRLDTTQFVVLGEGLAAGMADFGLREVYQKNSFPAQMAKQMKTLMPQPLIESPGIGVLPGFPALPITLPNTGEGSVRSKFPPTLFVFNLSIPGQRLSDALTRRPTSPVVQQRDPQQTMANLILGYPALIVGRAKPLWTQAEYALAMRPSLLLVELGYHEVLDAAVNDDPSRLPDVATFRSNYNALLSTLKTSYAQMVVLTIPDPFDTAYFTAVTSAPNLVGVPAAELQSVFRLSSADYLTPNGMMLVGNLVVINNGGSLLNPLIPGVGPSFPGTVVTAATKTAVSARVTALNAEIVSAANAAGAIVYDLRALFAKIKSQGLTVNAKKLTADMLGGFYSLDGYYPGSVGQGLIANELLTLLNTTFKKSFPLVDLNALATTDPVGRFTPAVRKSNVLESDAEFPTQSDTDASQQSETDASQQYATEASQQ